MKVNIRYYNYGLTVILLCMEPASTKKKSADHYFNLCRRNDPDLNDCIKRSIQELGKHFLPGIPDLKIPSADPMFISKMDMREGAGNFKFFATLKDVTMTGIRLMTIENVRIDLDNLSDVSLKLNYKVSMLNFVGKYDMGGRILAIPISGHGDFAMNFTNTKEDISVKGHVSENPRDHKRYLKIDSASVKISIKGGSCYFSNLFNNDKRLGASTNKFFNENFLDIFEALKHLPESAFSVIVKDMIAKVFNSFPLDELILP